MDRRAANPDGKEGRDVGSAAAGTATRPRPPHEPATGSLPGRGRPRASRRVLLVEDDPAIVGLIRDHLERDGFRVEVAADGAPALEAIRADRPDLVVLDLCLPDFDGFDVLAAVRRASNVPVVVVTGRVDEHDRVIGLEMGADDYVVKPFSTRELLARIRCVLRRTRPRSDSHELTFDGVTIDPGPREVTVHGRLVPTTSREFDLLYFLASSPRQVFDRGQLLRQVWNSSPDWQGGETVTEYIHRLRAKIEADPHHPRWITTVWGVGYRFEP